MKDFLSRFFLYFCIITVFGLCGFSSQASGQTPQPSLQATKAEAANTAASLSPPTPSTTVPTTAVSASPETIAPVQENVPAAPSPLATPAVQSAHQDAQVTLLNQAVFYIYADHNLYSAAQRAHLITERLKPLLQSIEDHPIEVIYRNDIAVLLRNKQELMTVTQADAQAAQLSLSQLAEYYAQKLQKGLQRAQIRNNMWQLIGDSFLALFITVVLILLLVVLTRSIPWLHQRLDSLRNKFLKEIRIDQAVLVSDAQLSTAMYSFLSLFRNILILILLYFYLPLVLSLFPWTKKTSSTLMNYVTAPLFKAFKAFISYIPSLFVIALVIAGTYYFLKLIKLIFGALDQGLLSYRGFEREWATPTYSIVRFLVMAFAAVVIFPYLPGSESPAFKSISLFLGILFSLGSSSAIANTVAGVVLTYMSPFRIGDRVKIAETMGDVIEKNLLVTRVRTIKNVRITIPNAMVLNSHIINYSNSARDGGLILHTSVTIGYDVPWQKVHSCLLEAAGRTSNILKDPAPFVLQTSLDDFYVAYEINAYTHLPNVMARTYSELHQHILDVCHAAEIEIMSPHFSAIRDGSAVNLPSDNLPPNYQAPGFKIFPWQSGAM